MLELIEESTNQFVGNGSKVTNVQFFNRGPTECGGGYNSYSLGQIEGNLRHYGSHNTYDCQCYPEWRFCGYSQHNYFVNNCIYEEGEIYATPPFFDLTSSFGAIPSSHLKKSSYTRPDGLTIVWDRFYPSDLCMWTLKSTANARKVTYDTANILNQDRNPNVKEVIMYVADAIHQESQTDNTLRVDVKELNCVSPDPTDQFEIYTNVDGSELYVFLEGQTTKMENGVQHGLQSAHKRIEVISDDGAKSVLHHSSTFRSTPSLK